MVKKRPGPIVRHRRKAAAQAAALGEITPAVAVRRDQYGWPLLEGDQVFVTRTGTVFHTGRCSNVVAILDDDPERVIVTSRSGIGARLQCRTCVEDGYS